MTSHHASALLLVAAACASCRAQDAAFARDVKPFLQAFCLKCHNSKTKRGGLDLARFSSPRDARRDLAAWPGYAARVRTHEMPPEGSRQPSIERRDAFLRWVSRVSAGKADDCRKLATDKTQNFYKGHVMSRRLTRGEYQNTIRDLVGVSLPLVSLLPADGSGDGGFDTTGDSLFTSAIHAEKYLQAAEMVLRAVLDTGRAPTHAVAAGERQKARKRLGLGSGGTTRGDASRIVAAFASRAYRRPVAAAEVARLLTVFDMARKRGDGFEASLRLPLKAILISPHFLFLVEPEGEKDGVVALPGYPLASRLSYFLWASMPDKELMSLAGKGELARDDVLRAQVRRMLKHPRARGLAESFGLQWLGLATFGESKRPDAGRFPEFTDGLAGDLREEAVRFVYHVFGEDRPLTDFIDANYVIVNGRLAKHYGLPGKQGAEWKKVSLKGRERGGVLGLGAVLTATSLPLRTSPVLRGKWVLEDLLGAHVPPPPPGVAELPADGKSAGGLTFRQQLEQHSKDPACASCHVRMDPLGFGLDTFDAIGRWRTKDDAGKVIDAVGKLPSGEKFAGPVELKAILLKRKGEFLRHFSRKMLGYALGRKLYKFDDCVIKEAMKALSAGEYRASRLMECIALSYPFRHRFIKK